MCPKHSRDDAPECADCRTLSRFTPALIEIGDSRPRSHTPFQTLVLGWFHWVFW